MAGGTAIGSGFGFFLGHFEHGGGDPGALEIASSLFSKKMDLGEFGLEQSLDRQNRLEEERLDVTELQMQNTEDQKTDAGGLQLLLELTDIIIPDSGDNFGRGAKG